MIPAILTALGVSACVWLLAAMAAGVVTLSNLLQSDTAILLRHANRQAVESLDRFHPHGLKIPIPRPAMTHHCKTVLQ